MGVVEATVAGVDATTAAPSPQCIGPPAFGEYVAYPEIERDEAAIEECAADRFARRIKLPALFVLAALEAGWLGALAYLLHRTVL